MDDKQKITQLEIQVMELKQQMDRFLSYSTLPKELEDALVNRGFLKYDGSVALSGGVSGQVLEYIFAKYNTKRSLIYVDNGYSQFSVNTTTDVCYSSNHPFSDGQQVLLYTTDSLPAGLNVASLYYIKNSTANTFQLSSDDISIDNITSTGTGTHYAVFFT